MPIRRNPIVGEMRALRESLGVTQDKLGNLVGFSHVQITRWENGHHHPSIDAVTLYLQALGYRLKIEKIPDE